MQKLAFVTLLQDLSSKSHPLGLYAYMCDVPFLERALFDSLVQPHQRPFCGEDLAGLQQYIQEAASGSLFSKAPFALIKFLKWNVTITKNVLEILKRVGKNPDFALCLLLPASARSVWKNDSEQVFNNSVLSYPPNDTELDKVIQIIFKKYSLFSKLSLDEKRLVSQKMMEYYWDNLNAIDDHFLRMEQSQISFDQAFAGNEDVNIFHILDAVAKKDIYLFRLRLVQALQSGNSEADVFAVINHFMKGLLALKKSFITTRDMNEALKLAQIPYPSYKRFTKAAENYSFEQLFLFFTEAPLLEFSLRTALKTEGFLFDQMRKFMFCHKK